MVQIEKLHKQFNDWMKKTEYEIKAEMREQEARLNKKMD